MSREETSLTAEFIEVYRPYDMLEGLCPQATGQQIVMQSTGFDLDTEWEPRRAEPTCPWPVDTAHLARYTLGDKALEKEVLDLFAGETPNRIDAFKSAQSDKDWKMAAHTLKGSGRAIGAWRLAHVAQEAERLSGIQDREACAEAIRHVEEAAAEVIAYIARLFPSQEIPFKKSA